MPRTAGRHLKCVRCYPPLPAAVIVTNHMVGGSDERRHEKRPAMGESWRNQPHCRRVPAGRRAAGAGAGGVAFGPAACTSACR